MNTLLKAVSLLLDYPDDALRAVLPEIATACRGDPSLHGTVAVEFQVLIDELANADLLDLQERYVATFDRGRACALNLFEHVHGESRDRGQAMIDLDRLYARAGLRLCRGQLPDYLPVMLEYLALRPTAEVTEMLADCAEILRSIGQELLRRGSPYAAIFRVLLAAAGVAGLEGMNAEEPADEEDLDSDWSEPPVLFGPAAEGCDRMATVAPITMHPRRRIDQVRVERGKSS